MRESVSSMALISMEVEGETKWLAQWNGKWQRYHLVGGHKTSDESFRECIVREIGEELALREGRDFTVDLEATACVKFEAWSESAQENTAYTMGLFGVKLVSGSARSKVDDDPLNRWISEAEIRGHRCADGQPICGTLELLLDEVSGMGRTRINGG